LGEVIVCLPVAEAQASARGLPVAGQVAHLLVHGLLHLLGYDHEASEAESERMQAHEDALLNDLGYAGQYEHGH
jgi:probable rRNA maturation factor